MRARAVLVLCLLAAAVPGRAATISGIITASATGTAIAGIEVRWLSQTSKGWAISQTTVTNGSGAYAFNVPAGDHIIQVVSTNRLDPQCFNNQRYYDVEAPFSNGALQSDADVLSVGAATSLTGINVALDFVGVLEGRVTLGGVGQNGMQVRVERISDSRLHYSDTTGTYGGNAGTFIVCGVLPGAYRVWIHPPLAQQEDLVAPGPYTVVSGARANAGSLALSAIGNDPYEPNSSTTSGTPVPAAPSAWVSSGAIIVPLGSDADFYCFNAVAGDRYDITTTTGQVIAGEARPSPWLDPVLGWFRTSPTQLLLSNDDDSSVQGPFNARIDTGVLAADGRYCVGVTTYGDADFNGSGQTSAGRYALRIAGALVFADGFEGPP